jgi:P-type Cu2+ transporter
MSASIDLSGFVREERDGLRVMDFAVEGICCAGCIGKIEHAVQRMPGEPSARLNYTTRRLKISWRCGDFQPGDVAGVLARLGYRAQAFDPGRVETDDSAHMKFLMRCLAVAGFAAMNVMLLSVSVWAGNASDIDAQTRDLFHWLSALIALPAAAFAGRPFFSSALRALWSRSTNMDVPISVGVSLALVMSVVETARHAEHAYFDSALMLLFFLLAGRVLDQGMRRKTRGFANNLASLRAPSANRLDPHGALVSVPVNSLNPGDLILVRPGERIAADGTIVSGSSEVDDSLITGETRHRPIAPGNPIYAGTLNLAGAVQVRVGVAGADTVLDEIERLLESASTTKSRYVRLADRVARLYAPVVHLAALATAIAWLLVGASVHDALVIAIAVLIITCPCALALAMPAVHVVTSGTLFRAGVLLHKGDAIERFAQVDTVVFDKTGTLTLPEPKLSNRANIPVDIVAMAARLALSSHHPLARSLAAEAGALTPLAEVSETPGQGVRTFVDGAEARLGSSDFCRIVAEEADEPNRGQSCIAFRHGGRTAIFHIKQAIRPDAVESIAGLKRAGLAVEVLSGDNAGAVLEVARALGVANAHGGLMPAAKYARLTELSDRGHKVLMVGDGLNDAPALAFAHASMSPGTAVDLTQSVADAVFLGEGLSPVCAAVFTCRKARRLMRQNLGLAVLYNALAVPLAMAGLVTPLIAAVAMSGSSLLVTLNALRAHRAEGLSPGANATAAGVAARVSGAARQLRFAR